MHSRGTITSEFIRGAVKGCYVCLSEQVGEGADSIELRGTQPDGSEGYSLEEQVERHYYPERYSFELFGDALKKKKKYLRKLQEQKQDSAMKTDAGVGGGGSEGTPKKTKKNKKKKKKKKWMLDGDEELDW